MQQTLLHYCCMETNNETTYFSHLQFAATAPGTPLRAIRSAIASPVATCNSFIYFPRLFLVLQLLFLAISVLRHLMHTV
jgi:hypothetical protein